MIQALNFHSPNILRNFMEAGELVLELGSLVKGDEIEFED